MGGRNITSDSELDFGIFIKQIIPDSLAAKDGKDVHTKLRSNLESGYETAGLFLPKYVLAVVLKQENVDAT